MVVAKKFGCGKIFECFLGADLAMMIPDEVVAMTAVVVITSVMSVGMGAFFKDVFKLMHSYEDLIADIQARFITLDNFR